MKNRLLSVAALFLSAASSLFAQGGMTPYFSDSFHNSSQTSSHWTINGSISETTSLQITSSSGAALISKVAVPDGTTQYEVSVGGSYVPGGSFTLYLEATSNAWLNLNGLSTGSFYAFVIQQSGTAPNCTSAQASLYRVVNGSVAQIASTSVACATSYMAMMAADGSMRLLAPRPVNAYEEPLIWTDPGTPLHGRPGMGAAGMPAGASITSALLYPLDRVAPHPIDPSSVKPYVQTNEADLRVGGVTDDSAGIGLYRYVWYRDGAYLASTFEPEYQDPTVEHGTVYTYGVAAMDYAGNTSDLTEFEISTPENAAIDPVQTGIRPTGTYWGGMGEQIDTRSGNLNYSYPLLTAVSRGWSVPLGLSYNSQTWRYDNNGWSWNLGFDNGYGYGWTLQFGSITPYYTSDWSVAFYEYRDAGGASYRLDQNANGMWTSRQSIYLSYDAAHQILRFNNGSRWFFSVRFGRTGAGCGNPVSHHARRFQRQSNPHPIPARERRSRLVKRQQLPNLSNYRCARRRVADLRLFL